MKEVIAIIRPKKVGPTKDALEKLGYPGVTAVQVLGRGHQRGIAAEVSIDSSAELLSHGRTAGMKYIPKRLLSIVVHDEDAASVVQEVIKINQSAQIGDGKIFICPVVDALRVRTGERGEAAVS